jgi:cAMP-dependent protein kinase regulator
MVVSNNVLELTRDFLARQLFTGFAKSNGQEDRITSMTTVVFASTALLWLYSVFLAFSSIAVELTPALWNTAMDLGRPTRAFSAAVVLLAVVSLALAPAWKLTEILLQNLLAATSTPVRKARQSILAYQSSGVSPSDAVVQFLRNIPILGQMDDPTMRRLVQVMQLRTVKKGDIIIKQGDAGDSFFIMALGQAQVLRELTGGQTEILDIVEAGDSFGEIALLEKTTRTATVRALTDTKVLALSKRNFDVLFPDGTDDRRLLTAIIRQAKLIVSSQGLSHLAPKQVRELLHYIKPVSFKAGDVLIKQGTEGDDVYLIESGKVEVTKTRDDGFKAQLGRGDLVGLIAVVKKVARTATVTALEDTTALKIDGNTFMRMCRSNIIVATVMADLSQSQMKEGDRLERAS